MNWIYLSLASAFLIGIYDVFKKRSLADNAVIPTLFLSTIAGAIVWVPLVILSAIQGPTELPELLYVQPLGWEDHLRFITKSLIVATSWTLSYFGLKALPVSVAGSVRATGPLWTLAGALLIFSERPSVQQWIGISITLISFYALSLAGRKEGLVFHRDKGIWLMIGGTLAGAASSLFDKHLMGSIGYKASTAQAWFMIYMVVALSPLLIGWLRSWWPRGKFEWRWTIPMIGLSLLASDYLYFSALRDQDALVAVVSCVRRSGVLVSFTAGYLLFRERNYRRKTPCILGILAGVVVIAFA